MCLRDACGISFRQAILSDSDQGLEHNCLRSGICSRQSVSWEAAYRAPPPSHIPSCIPRPHGSPPAAAPARHSRRRSRLAAALQSSLPPLTPEGVGALLNPGHGSTFWCARASSISKTASILSGSRVALVSQAVRLCKFARNSALGKAG
jgi:hypothetical protein